MERQQRIPADALIRVMEEFVASGKIDITPPLFNQDDLRRRLVVTLNLTKVVQHMWESLIPENTESLVPAFDTERPIVWTGNMRTWYKGKPCEFAKRSHINFCVFDSTREASDEFEMDRNKNVAIILFRHRSLNPTVELFWPRSQRKPATKPFSIS